MEVENQTIQTNLSDRQRASVLLNSFIVIAMGLFGGLVWVIALAGSLELWPIPPIELSIPENKELWRNAHIGPIMNGIFAMAIVGVSNLITLSPKATKVFYYATIIMLWFNTIGYQTAPYTSDRGLGTMGDSFNVFCYFSFYIAALSAIVLVGLGIYGSSRTLSLMKK